MKTWEKLLNFLFVRSKIAKRINAFIVIVLLFGGFGWSENYWTAGGSFWIAFLVELIFAVIASLYAIVCWAADDKWRVE